MPGPSRLGVLVSLVLAGAVSATTGAQTTPPQRPNVVLILADDMGLASVNALNPDSGIPTPHIDRLLAQGMTFTDAHSGSAVCSPTRYGLLTGRYSWRTRMKRGIVDKWAAPLIDETRMTLADMLLEEGYQTACVGKWHLGWDWPDALGEPTTDPTKIDYTLPIRGGPLSHGFLSYFGDDVPNWPPYLWIEDDRALSVPTGHMKEVEANGVRAGPMTPGWELDAVLPAITQRCVDTIAGRATSPEPFFLFFSMTSPHTPISPSAAFRGKSGISDYADFLMETDWAVGEVLQALEEHSVADDTLVIFTADNGTSPKCDFELLAAQGTDLHAQWRGSKADIWEGGHRVPFVVRWPGVVRPGTESDATVCLTDVMATVADAVGYALPDDACEDGFSLLPVLRGDEAVAERREPVVNHSSAGRFAIRSQQWKLVFCRGSGGWSAPGESAAVGLGLPEVQLYDMTVDEGEQHNLQAEHPGVVAALTARLRALVEAGRSTPGEPQRGEDPVWWSKLPWPEPGQDPDPSPDGGEPPVRAPFEGLDTLCVNDWWEREASNIIDLHVPRGEVVAFGLYTVQDGVLGLSAQLFPLYPGETRVVRLELEREGAWEEVARESVNDIGWSAIFRLEGWDATQDVPYRLRHGEAAVFEGLIRRDPVEKDEIVLAALSCNSNQDRGLRPNYVRNLRHQDPDLLFFAGDQSYDHKQHTAAWLKFGLQFRDLFRDRPCVTIPDDHDIGQGNLWGEGGKVAELGGGADGGYAHHPEYVRMVERCQTAHLPEPPDPTPVEQGIGVYFTHLVVGGVDFAILEDRKFKSGPAGKIPQQGPRPDHIRDPHYDPASIDLPGLTLLGERQLAFLDSWGADRDGVAMKAVLSQTGFCGGAHLHGSQENRLHADLDSNGWPQTGRQAALRAIRDAGAIHVAGDQHLATLIQHGIDGYRDGPWAFVVPAIVNDYYGRWWWPEDEAAGGNHDEASPLPWTGDYLDGFGNRITMHAYANPETTSRGAGYGLVRFEKSSGRVTFECWPRDADVTKPGAEQFAGWPRTIELSARER